LSTVQIDESVIYIYSRCF